MSDYRDTTTLYGQHLTEAEYLRVEESAKERSEYIAGRLFAMSGSSAAHNRIVSNLQHLLYARVNPAGCDVFTNDMKVKVESIRTFYYPDVVVTCEEIDQKSVYIVAPCLIIEVLSPSTIKTDEREKLYAYGLISSVTEYLLVHQDKVRIEMNRKDESGGWELSEYGNGSTITLLSLPGGPFDLKVDEIYQRLKFEG